MTQSRAEFTFEVLFTCHDDEFDLIESSLEGAEGAGVYLMEGESGNLESAVVMSILAAASTAAAIKALRDVVIETLKNRRVKVLIRRPDGEEVEYEGPLSNKGEVHQIVNVLTPPELPERGDAD